MNHKSEKPVLDVEDTPAVRALLRREARTRALEQDAYDVLAARVPAGAPRVGLAVKAGVATIHVRSAAGRVALLVEVHSGGLEKLWSGSMEADERLKLPIPSSATVACVVALWVPSAARSRSMLGLLKETGAEIDVVELSAR